MLSIIIISNNYNITKVLLKPITNIISCKQYISRKAAIILLLTETAINREILELLYNIILNL